MVVEPLRESSRPETSSLDTPTRVISTWPDCDERRPTATVGGDYALSPIAEDDDRELRSWAELARRSLARWAKENPY